MQGIRTAIDGVIEAVLVREGERVKTGQLLARLDRSQAEATLARLQAEVFNRPLNFPPRSMPTPPSCGTRPSCSSAGKARSRPRSPH